MNRRSLLKLFGLAPVAVAASQIPVPAAPETSISEFNNAIRAQMSAVASYMNSTDALASYDMIDDRFWSGAAPMQGIGLDRNRMRQ